MTKRFPTKHVSVRVPWHDAGWNGSVCKDPGANAACTKLKKIAQEKDESKEFELRGQEFDQLAHNDLPPCLSERGAFMAPFPLEVRTSHPYASLKETAVTHGHLIESPLAYPPYSIPSVPFNWMLAKSMAERRKAYNLDLDPKREPNLSYKTWVQHGDNQRALLDAFAQHLEEDNSLCFIYAKSVPFVEKAGRVLIGVGRIKSIGPLTQFLSKAPSGMPSYFWERMLSHSIRPGFPDGFILPYHQLIKAKEKNPSLVLEDFAAMAPDDAFDQFSYASELVSQDGAIAALLSIRSALNKLVSVVPGNWDKCFSWIDGQLAIIWEKRGPYPGLSSMLSAVGVDLAHSIAYYLIPDENIESDPWPKVEQTFLNPTQVLPSGLAEKIGKEHTTLWSTLSSQRKDLFRLLCRFDLTEDQAKTAFNPERRESYGWHVNDDQILRNPYLLYEGTRHLEKSVGLNLIDRGLFPDNRLREKFPIEHPSAVSTLTDPRRVRSIIVQALELEASKGNTLYPKKALIQRISQSDCILECPLTSDLAQIAELSFEDSLQIVHLKNGEQAYQLVPRLIESEANYSS